MSTNLGSCRSSGFSRACGWGCSRRCGARASRPHECGGGAGYQHVPWERGRPARKVRLGAGRHLVRIRIYGIMGFSGFRRLVFDRQALIRIRPMRKAQDGRNEIMKIPPILKILILAEARGWRTKPSRPKSSARLRGPGRPRSQGREPAPQAPSPQNGFVGYEAPLRVQFRARQGGRANFR